MMKNSKFTFRLKEAAFKSKKEFAQHVGKHENTVCNWGEGEGVPKWVWIYLELRIRVLNLAYGLGDEGDGN